MWQPTVRMRDRWHDNPIFPFWFVMAFTYWFWWGIEDQRARLVVALGAGRQWARV